MNPQDPNLSSTKKNKQLTNVYQELLNIIKEF